MIILITGTPGTGKTTIAPLLGKTLKCPVIDVNQLVDEKHLYTGVDPEKGYKIRLKGTHGSTTLTTGIAQNYLKRNVRRLVC